jgi:hypothetical protein
MSLATGLAWLAFALVFFLVDPLLIGTIGIFMFYLSLMLALLGTIAIFGFFIRVKLRGSEAVIVREVSGAFRQGFFLSFLFTSSLYLQSKNLLVWWNLLLLISALTILEFLFISYRRNR